MKIKTTNKSIKAGYDKVIAIGYCDAESLLRYSKPFAYTAGVDGWNADFYSVNRVCISTGYRPISQNVKPCYELARKYDKKAREIILSDIDYTDKQNQVLNLLSKFVEEATQQKETANPAESAASVTNA
jgi:hypothetical protein